MKIIIPMAGHGRRFIDAGYKQPKPLISVGGKKILEYIVSMFSKDDEFIFICDETHLATTDMSSVINSFGLSNSKIVGIAPHSLGPVHTTLQLSDEINDDDEVIICYCDNPYLWDYADFKKHVLETSSDGCVLTHSGFHPHRLSSTYMAYLKVNNGQLVEIQEKRPYTDNHMAEHASTGTYYFKKGSYVKKYFRKLIEENVNYNGEFYVTLVYNLMCRDGLKTTIYDTETTMVFGTPEEVQNFEAWRTIINSTQVKSGEDAAKCFDYWRRYYDKTNIS